MDECRRRTGGVVTGGYENISFIFSIYKRNCLQERTNGIKDEG
jgi:hypothetical protein